MTTSSLNAVNTDNVIKYNDYLNDIRKYQEATWLTSPEAKIIINKSYSQKGLTIEWVWSPEVESASPIWDWVKWGFAKAWEWVMDIPKDIKDWANQLGVDLYNIKNKGVVWNNAGLLGKTFEYWEKWLERMNDIARAGREAWTTEFDIKINQWLALFGVWANVFDDAVFSTMKTLAPQDLENFTKEKFEQLINSEWGQALIKEVKKQSENWENFKNSSPEAKYFGLSLEWFIRPFEYIAWYSTWKTVWEWIVAWTAWWVKKSKDVIKKSLETTVKWAEATVKLPWQAYDKAQTLMEDANFFGGEWNLSLEELINRTGQIDRSNKKEYNQFKKGLDSINLKWIENYNDLTVVTNSRIWALSKYIDGTLDNDTTFKITDFNQQIGRKNINYIQEAIKDLTSLYENRKEYKKLEEFENRFLNNKFDLDAEWNKVPLLTNKDINDLARWYGSEMAEKAYNKDWSLKNSNIWHSAESIRSWIKDISRWLMWDDITRAIDLEISSLYSVKDKAEKIVKKAWDVRNKYLERGGLYKTRAFISGLLDTLTAWTVGWMIQKHMPRWVWEKQANFDQLDQLLEKRLKLIDKLQKADNEKQVTSILKKHFNTDDLEVYSKIEALPERWGKVDEKQINEFAETFTAKYIYNSVENIDDATRGQILQKVKDYTRTFLKDIGKHLVLLMEEVAEILKVWPLKFMSEKDGKKRIPLFNFAGKQYKEWEWINNVKERIGWEQIPQFKNKLNAVVKGTKIYDYLDNKTTVSIQDLKNQANRSSVKEQNMILDIVDRFETSMPWVKKIAVVDFVDEMMEVDLNLDIRDVGQRYEDTWDMIKTASDLWWASWKYTEYVYWIEWLDTSTSTHFSSHPDYFWHVRVIDYTDDKWDAVRIIWEKQSDIFQKDLPIEWKAKDITELRSLRWKLEQQTGITKREEKALTLEKERLVALENQRKLPAWELDPFLEMELLKKEKEVAKLLKQGKTHQANRVKDYILYLAQLKKWARTVDEVLKGYPSTIKGMEDYLTASNQTAKSYWEEIERIEQSLKTQLATEQDTKIGGGLTGTIFKDAEKTYPKNKKAYDDYIKKEELRFDVMNFVWTDKDWNALADTNEKLKKVIELYGDKVNSETPMLNALNKIEAEKKQLVTEDKKQMLQNYNLALQDWKARLTREEINRAIEDGTDTLLFPTGKTIPYFEWFLTRAGDSDFNRDTIYETAIWDEITNPYSWDFFVITEKSHSWDYVTWFDKSNIENQFNLNDAMEEEVDYNYDEFLDELMRKWVDEGEMLELRNNIEKAKLDKNFPEDELNDLMGDYDDKIDKIEEIKQNYSSWDFDNSEYVVWADEYYVDYIEGNYSYSWYNEDDGYVYILKDEFESFDIPEWWPVDLKVPYEEIKADASWSDEIMDYYQYQVPKELKQATKQFKIDFDATDLYYDDLGYEYYQIDLSKSKRED